MDTIHSSPLVSIIIPTYNYARYLLQALRSCLDQTYGNLEIIVIDDGSTDNTRETIKEMEQKIVYVYQQNQGVSSARNKGLEIAKGDFIAFLDADDYLLEDSIQSRLEILLRHEDIGVVFCETYSKNVNDTTLSLKPVSGSDIVSERFYEDLLVRHLRFQTSTALMRSPVAKRFRFPVNFSNGEDIVYFTKVFFSAKGYFLVKPGVVNQRHADSLRHNVEEIKKQGIDFVAAIVDDPCYNGALDYLRKELTANRYLELFRRYYLSGEKGLARECFIKGIKTKPGKILKVDYLVKFIKTYF